MSANHTMKQSGLSARIHHEKMEDKKFMKRAYGRLIAIFGLMISGAGVAHGDIVAKNVKSDLTKAPPLEAFKDAKEETIVLMAQPMAVPRPAATTTAKVFVRAIHDNDWVAFALRWADSEKSEAGRLAKFSDAVAMQFPVKDHKNPPPIFMGAKGAPVHIYHWRAQYQLDKEKGVRTIKDLYPNMVADIYPMEFPDMGKLHEVDEGQREFYSYGRAAGNPQSYVKKGVDEILAEGYGTSSVIENVAADANGVWNAGEWNVVITRPLKRPGASELDLGASTFMGFAVWQGGKDEVGSRKSVTMSWTPLRFESGE